MDITFIGVVSTLSFFVIVGGIIQEVRRAIRISSNSRYKRYRAMQKQAQQKQGTEQEQEAEPKQESTTSEKSSDTESPNVSLSQLNLLTLHSKNFNDENNFRERQMDNNFQLNTIEEALEDFREGKFLIVVDDEDRENEGDFVIAAEKITPEAVNFMLHEGRGVLCVPITMERCEELELPKQVPDNTSILGTPFTVTVDKIEGCTTGVSSEDRAATIRALADPTSTPQTFGRPGHINPLYAQNRGVLRRAGHTEASVDLARLAGLYPAAALIEIMNEDGSMARMPQLIEISKKFGIKIIAIKDLIAYRLREESIIRKGSEADLPTEYGHFQIKTFIQKSNGVEHIALIKGSWQKDEPILVRMHSSCATGDIFASQRCDCGEQLHVAMQTIEKEGKGVVVYLSQEGRGIGLTNKLKAYELQQNGMDTVEANVHLGFRPDERDYGVGASILRELGVGKMRLMTNNPVKRIGLESYGLKIVEVVPIETTPNQYNERYLKTKKEKMGHTLHKL